MKNLRMTLIVLLSVIACPTLGNVELPAEAIESLKALSRAFDSIELDCKMAVGSSPFKGYLCRKFHESVSILSQDDDESQSAISVHCMNDKYGFVLRGNEESAVAGAQQDWLISDVGTHVGEKIKVVFNATVADFLLSPVKIFACPEMEELLASDSFVILSTKASPDSTIRIEFSYKASEAEAAARFPFAELSSYKVAGYAIFLAERSWAIKEYDVTVESSAFPTARVVGELDYPAEDGSSPYPTSLRISHYSDKQKTIREFRAKSWSQPRLIQADFYLSHYGLPEILDVKPSLFGFRGLLFLTGTVLVLVGACVVMIHRLTQSKAKQHDRRRYRV